MIYVTFITSAIIIVLAASKLAQYGDVISVRGRLGGLFVGTLLMAGATSLPELLSAFNAIQLNVPDLAAGSMFGSNMFNMFMLGLLDLFNRNARVLRLVANSHSLTASLGSLMIALAALFILADIPLKIGWVGIDSLLIIAVYLGGVRLLQNQGGPRVDPEEIPADAKIPSMRRALLGFGLATLVLVLVTPYLVSSANQIAESTGLGVGFIGATLIAITTSLPELVATISAVRLGAFDLAVGNLFGSNIFNMFALGLSDFFYTQGRFLDTIDSSFAIAGLLGLILTSLGLIGNLARVERRIGFLEIDAFLILLGYVLGMYLLYTMGVSL
jgi:cation:H+ antiporter